MVKCMRRRVSKLWILTPQKKKFVSGLLLLLITGMTGKITLQTELRAESQTVDLNLLLQTKFDEYNAWLVRRLSLNGTTSDTFDYSRVAGRGDAINVSLSFPSYLIALAYMYEGTNNDFYLRQLQSYIDGALNNSLFYVDVPEIGQIFTPPSWYWDNQEKETGCIYPGIFGYISTKLYLWTGLQKYKAIADRIASESYDKLAVVKNSTDVAWSWAYYHSRDEANAKLGVNRQTFMAWFYALYGNNINSTFQAFVSRIINWVWRAQLADDSLAYSIGRTTTNTHYTAFAVTATLNAYLINSSSFSTALKDKIKGTLAWLDAQGVASYDYQHLYVIVPALLTALKTDYFASSVSAIKAKSMLYVALDSMHLTNKGFIPRISHYSFGFRWQQLHIGTLFAVYPLTDYSLDMNQFNPVTTYEIGKGQYKINGWAGEIFTWTLRDGRDHYGSQVAGAGRSLHFNPAGWQPAPSSVSITDNTYYIRIRSVYSAYTVEYYAYPVGVFVGDVTGTTTPNIVLDDNPLWRIRAANGSEWQLTALTDGDIYNFGTKMLLYLNDTNPANRRSFFVKNNKTANWKYAFVSSTPRLNFSTTQTNYRIIFGEIVAFGHLIQDAATMYSVLESLVDAHDITQPVSFITSFNALHGKITELEPDATWKTLYQSAQSGMVKLVGHNLPEQVSISEWSYGNDILTYTVSASSGTTSITRVYVGDKGEPKRAYASNGTLSWSYDASTKTLELKVTHNGPTQIIIDWRMPGDVNGDGTVDILDAGEVSAHWYLGPPIGPLGYDLNADLNYDGAVNIFDAAIVSAYWTGPPKGPLDP